MQDGSSLHFTFDKVHGLPNGAANTQADVFSDIQDIVLSTLQGLNGCVMAYGQTGTESGRCSCPSWSSRYLQGMLLMECSACCTRVVRFSATQVTSTKVCCFKISALSSNCRKYLPSWQRFITWCLIIHDLMSQALKLQVRPLV